MSAAGPRTDDSSPSPEFRWQAFFQRCSQPLFLLDRQRRIRFVNRAWEALTGLPSAEVRLRTCTRRAPAEAGSGDAVLQALAPPPEVLAGRPAQVRRRVSGSDWDIDFLPLREGDGLLGIVGRIQARGAGAEAPALPEGLAVLHEQASKLKARQNDPDELWQPQTLLNLRQRVVQRYRLEYLGDETPALRQAAEQVRLVSGNQTTVLIRGEAGTGKRWLARTIHHHGAGGERPFAVVDAAHLPPEAVAALLFGDQRTRRTDLGTLYLAEPAQLPRDLQARLCDVLLSGPRGWRLLAGARADLVDEVKAGRLLEELRCALSTVVIHLPPLRERQPDLARLVEVIRERIAAESDTPSPGLTPEAWELLRSYAWPGNLSELEAVLSSAASRATGRAIEANDLPAYLRLAVRLEAAPVTVAEGLLPLDALLREAERRLLLLALERTHGHRARAADLLAIQRPRLFRRLKALGLADNLGPEEEEPPIEAED